MHVPSLRHSAEQQQGQQQGQQQVDNNIDPEASVDTSPTTEGGGGVDGSGVDVGGGGIDVGGDGGSKDTEKMPGIAESLKAPVSASIGEKDTEPEGKKRKREVDPDAAAKNEAKKAETLRKAGEADWGQMLQDGTLDKATVPMMQAYCQLHGLKRLGVKKDLLEAVEKHLNLLTSV